MNDVKQNDKTPMSLSKTRKINRKKQIEQMKRNSRLSKIIWICAIAVISVGIVALISTSVYRNINRVKPSDDYSAFLTDDGLIKDVTATSLLQMEDYTNITVPLSEVEYSDASVKKDIKELLKEEATLSTETDALIEDGDKVNADYVGTVDGVEFEGGSTGGQGSDIEIGSGKLIDDFEQQLIGHGIGDKVTVEATFPEEYSSNPDLAGKDAIFEVVINGIYVAELTDEYVKENLSEYATTAAEYKEYVKQSKYEENLKTWLEDYMMEHTTVNSYPEDFTNHLKSLQKFGDQNYFEYMKQLYASMGSTLTSFEQFIGMSEEKYDASLVEVAQEQAKKALIYQAIFELEKLPTVTEADYTGDDFATRVEQSGKGFVMQELVQNKVIERLKELITVK